MTRALGLRLAHMPGESPQSLASRLAARNGLGLGEFARHMRLSPTAIANDRAGALEDLAALAGTDLGALRREAIAEAGDGWSFRGEALAISSMRRLRLRVCPRCLAEDVESAQVPEWAAYGRTIWMIEPIRTCRRHAVGLVAAAEPTANASEFWDVTWRIRPLLPHIGQLAAEAPTRAPSRLETYMLDRLDGGRGGGWLDGLPFHAVAVGCEWVGAVALHGPHVTLSSFDDDDRRAAGDAGHEIACDGRIGFSAFCDGMRRLVAAGKANTDGQKVFGHLWHALRLREKDAAYEPLRRMMAELMAEARPVAAGTLILGMPIEARVTHSVSTGALASGVHVQTFRRVLEREGVLDRHGPRVANSLTVVEVRRIDEVMRRLERSLSYKDAMAYLNVPRHAGLEIYEAGLVAPRSRLDEGSRHRKLYLEFAEEDLDAFLAALLEGAEEREVAREGEVEIRLAARQNHCGIADVVRLVLDRRLPWVGHLRSQEGFMALLVRGADVAPLVRGEEPPGISEGRVRHRLRADHRSVPVLIAEGRLERFEARHPRLRAPQAYVSIESLERFESEYASLSTLGAELGMPANRVKSRLSKRGVEPALTADTHFSAFYLWRDLPGRVRHDRPGRSATRRDGHVEGSAPR